jgi:squalene cyclase
LLQALSAALACAKLGNDFGAALELDCIDAAVDIMLGRQNPDGGIGTYEAKRTFTLLELLNPTESFGRSMLDYSTMECTSSCICALHAVRRQFPGHRTAELEHAIQRGIAFVEREQCANGSWFGEYAVCFTSGGWFAAKALQAAGGTYLNNTAQAKGVEFLLGKQRVASDGDGGWGESFLSYSRHEYVEKPGVLIHHLSSV